MHFQCSNCDKKGKTVEDLRSNGCNCSSRPLEMLDSPEEAEKVTDSKKKKKEEDLRSPAKKIYDFAMSKIERIVISENNSDEVYVLVKKNDHVESLKVESKQFRHWLRGQYSSDVENLDLHGDDIFKTVADEIISRAHVNGTERVQIHNRIAQLEGEILYDLGTQDWKITKITPEGMETVSFDPTLPVFHRRQSLQTQVIPKEGDGKELGKLTELLHILDEDKLVFIVHLVSMFLESCAVPMMVFDGSAGSLKTTATATIKRMVDPNGKGIDDNVSAMAEKSDDLIIQINNRYLASFDNVSFINQNTSDVLCRAITGSGNMRRKKYTDDNEIIQNFRRKIVLNGIVPTLDYPDLQTRLLSYARKPVDESNRISEKEFNEKLESLLPGLLAKIFISLSKALKAYPVLKTKIKPKTRMADFEIWGEIISRVLGHSENSFLDSYHRKMAEGQISQIDSHPIVAAIQKFMEAREQYENTASHLYQELVTIAANSGTDINSRYVRFPKTSSYMIKELKIVDPLLKTIDFMVETYHYTKSDGKFGKNVSIVRITRRNAQSTLDVSGIASPASPPSPPSNLGTKTGEATGEAMPVVVSPASLKNMEFTHNPDAGEPSEGSEAIRGRSSPRQFYCKTCNAGPWAVDTKGSSGMPIYDFHKNQGHEIEFVEGEK